MAIPGLGSPGSTKTLMSEALGGTIWDRRHGAASASLEHGESNEEGADALEESLLPTASERGSAKHRSS